MSKRTAIIGIAVLIILVIGAGAFILARRQPSQPQASGGDQAGMVEGAEGTTGTETFGEVAEDEEYEEAYERYSSDYPVRFMAVPEGHPNYGEHETAGAYMKKQISAGAGAFVAPDSERAEASLAPVATGVIDTDKDGLTDEQELNLGTDPNNPDTDGDGLTDFEEVTVYRTDPKNFDTDGDGLTDGEEVQTYGTNPLIKDTDGDGYSDGDEVRAGYNPLGSGSL